MREDKAVEPDRLSRELAEKLEAARMTAEKLSLDAGLSRDAVGRWIRGRTVPAAESLRRVERTLGTRLGCKIDLTAAVRERRSAQQGRHLPRDRTPQGGSGADHGTWPTTGQGSEPGAPEFSWKPPRERDHALRLRPTATVTRTLDRKSVV